MNPQNKKDACLMYRTIVEAAKEMEKDEALELLLAYADYALGDTDEIITDNKYIKLILKQVVPSLRAADNRYRAAVDNGNKGKESGKNGGGVGRPKKGETKEDYQKRVEEWKQSKNPQKNPQNSFEEVSCYTDQETTPDNPVITPNNPIKTPDNNPVFEKTSSQGLQNPQKNPLDVDVDVEEDVEVDKDIDVEEDKDVLPTCKINVVEEEKSLKEFEEESFKDMKDSFNIVSTKVNLNEDITTKGFVCCSNFINTYQDLDYQLLLRNPQQFLSNNEIKLGSLSNIITSSTGVYFSKGNTTQLLTDYVRVMMNRESQQ